jgi:hypothetical protein
MQLVYQLGGAGWADARISHNSKYRDMAVSYLSDALGDMTQAAVRLVRGAREVSFSFQDEPGEHRWLLTRGESDSLRIRILWFHDTFSRRPQECGEEVFICDCTVLDFIGQVLHELHDILSEEGVDGYKRRWQNHDFPLDAYTELQRVLTPQL